MSFNNDCKGRVKRLLIVQIRCGVLSVDVVRYFKRFYNFYLHINFLFVIFCLLSYIADEKTYTKF